ncbi:uncharacterized protein LOC131638036 [Vicia villosa]|uniref:uncharacterized protein LOC131638036 n=1 Tax=Vicia villosa TaxID=3911 RepID=UPI00273C8131|nr:uncharacterized protein LOC131638036 [Vicia villosa]
MLYDAVFDINCSTLHSIPQSQHVLAPRRGRPPKSFGLPTFAVKPTLEDQTNALLETSNKQNINERTYAMHLQSTSIDKTPSIVPHKSTRLTTPSPVFNPAVNLDFQSEEEDDSDYDPFAVVDFDKDFSTDDDNITGSYSMPHPSNERMEKHKHSANPKYSMCCGNGKVEPPFLKTLPPQKIPTSNTSLQHDVHIHISWCQLDNKYNNGCGPPTLRIQGQSCHRIGSLLPSEGQKPKFAQLYIYDTENEVENRMDGLRNPTNIDPEIFQQLSSMLYEHNTHAKSFQREKERINSDNVHNLKLRLISDRKTDGRIYNHPTMSEVAALIVGDVDTAEERDIIMEKRSGKLKRIDEFHAIYLAYQYTLIFPYGEDGYRPDVAHRDLEIFDDNKRNRLTIREWIVFRIQSRSDEAKTLLSSRRLFQQFLVDGYTMMDSERLTWLRNNQSKLRVSKYNNLNEEGDESVALGSSLDMYTIEFQKRGLPHAHILIFLHPSNKHPTPSDIDRIISAEIPDPVLEPRLYNLVKTHMVHGPCGLANQNSQCMKEGKCSKYYQKKFQSTTVVDQDEYPI